MQKIFQELSHFFRRDFQDYSRQDYRDLSQGSRFTLLAMGMLLLIFGSFTAWRYFYERDQKQQITRALTGLQSRILLLQTQIDAARKFLMLEDFQEIATHLAVNKQALVQVREPAKVREQEQEAVRTDQGQNTAVSDHQEREGAAEAMMTDLLHAVTAQLAHDGLSLISMTPQKASLALKNIGTAQQITSSQKPLINRRTQTQGGASAQRPAFSLSYLGALFVILPSISLHQDNPDLARMTLTLNVCGTQGALFAFLGNISRQARWVVESEQVSQPRTSRASECRDTALQVTLHFYPLKAASVLLSQKLPALISATGMNERDISDVHQFRLPYTIPHLQRYLATDGLAALDRWGQRSFEAQSSAALLGDITAFDLPFQGEPDMNHREEQDQWQMQNEGETYFWGVGMRHKEMTLRGIVQVDARYLVLIEQGRGEIMLRPLDQLGLNIMKIETGGIAIILE